MGYSSLLMLSHGGLFLYSPMVGYSSILPWWLFLPVMHLRVLFLPVMHLRVIPPCSPMVGIPPCSPMVGIPPCVREIYLPGCEERYTSLGVKRVIPWVCEESYSLGV